MEDMIPMWNVNPHSKVVERPTMMTHKPQTKADFIIVDRPNKSIRRGMEKRYPLDAISSRKKETER